MRPPTPRRARAPGQWRVYLGVTLMGGALSMLLGMINEPPVGWAAGLTFAVFGGVISIAWAYAFISERMWVLVPTILAQVLLPNVVFAAMSSLAVFDIGTSISPGWRRIVLSLMIVAGVSTGFALIIYHVRKSERSSQRAKAELDLARQIHRALVPDITLRAGRVEILGRSIPSAEMGGDLVDVVMPQGESGHVDIYLADVSGHGVKAGIVMSMVKSAIRTRLLADDAPGAEPAPLHALLADLNRVLETLIAPEMFATFACLRFDAHAGGGVEFALAGHLPILHYRATERRVFELPNEHLPLGLDASEAFTSAAATAEPGDTFAIFTDGLTETADARGRQFGLAGVREAFEHNVTRPLPELFDRVLNAAASHGSTTDDRTLLLVRVR